MAHPTHYTSQVAISLPPDDEIRKVVGESYDPNKALNVVKMFARDRRATLDARLDRVLPGPTAELPAGLAHGKRNR